MNIKLLSIVILSSVAIAIAAGYWQHHLVLKPPPFLPHPPPPALVSPTEPPPATTSSAQVPPPPISAPLCLKDGEIATIWYNDVAVKNAKTKEVIRIIDLPGDAVTQAFSTDPVREIRKCGVYIVRPDAAGVNYLWRYSYDGNGEQIHKFAWDDAEKFGHLGTDFRINDSETYIALFGGVDGLNFVNIRDLATWKSFFTTSRSGMNLENQMWSGDTLSFYVKEENRPLRGYTGTIDTKSWTITWSK